MLSDRELQDRARDMIGREVYSSASHLVAALLQNFEVAQALGIGEEELFALGERQPDAGDYSDQAPEGLTVLQRDHDDQPGAGQWEWFGPNSDEVYGDDEGAYFDSELEAWESAYDANQLDRPTGSEIFEHWIVSDWLAAKLEAEGETIARDFLGFTIWGRATTGQAIYIDGVIEKIARQLWGDSEPSQ